MRRIPRLLTGTNSERRSLLARIDARLKPDGDCLVWTGATAGSANYGIIRYQNRLVFVHRARWFATHGALPQLLLLHSCDNPPCARLDHLRIGTDKDNSDDKWTRGRGPIGERNGMRKLTTEQVAVIRERSAAGESKASIARDYPVSRQVVSEICHGRLWPINEGVAAQEAKPQRA